MINLKLPIISETTRDFLKTNFLKTKREKKDSVIHNSKNWEVCTLGTLITL